MRQSAPRRSPCGVAGHNAPPHAPAMFVVTEAEAAAIRAVYEQRGEFSAAIELRRRFPGITDNAQARECARTIAGWKPLRPVKRMPKAAAVTSGPLTRAGCRRRHSPGRVALRRPEARRRSSGTTGTAASPCQVAAPRARRPIRILPATFPPAPQAIPATADASRLDRQRSARRTPQATPTEDGASTAPTSLDRQRPWRVGRRAR